MSLTNDMNHCYTIARNHLQTKLEEGADETCMEEILLFTLHANEMSPDNIKINDTIMAATIDEMLSLHDDIAYWERHPMLRMPRVLYMMMNGTQLDDYHQARRSERQKTRRSSRSDTHPHGRPAKNPRPRRHHRVPR